MVLQYESSDIPRAVDTKYFILASVSPWIEHTSCDIPNRRAIMFASAMIILS
jgi:hypothetical protein